MLVAAVERADLLQVLLDHLHRPVEHGQHVAPSRRPARHRLAVADAERPERSERRRVRVAREIDHIQLRALLAAQPPRVHRLEQRRVAQRRQRPLAPQRAPARHPRVAVVEERLQLIARQRPAPGVRLELRHVHDQVALIDDLLRPTAQPLGADRHPRIAAIGQVVAEQPDRDLVLAQRRDVKPRRRQIERSSIHSSRCSARHSHGHAPACARNRRTSRSRGADRARREHPARAAGAPSRRGSRRTAPPRSAVAALRRRTRARARAPHRSERPHPPARRSRSELASAATISHQTQSSESTQQSLSAICGFPADADLRRELDQGDAAVTRLQVTPGQADSSGRSDRLHSRSVRRGLNELGAARSRPNSQGTVTEKWPTTIDGVSPKDPPDAGYPEPAGPTLGT